MRCYTSKGSKPLFQIASTWSMQRRATHAMNACNKQTNTTIKQTMQSMLPENVTKLRIMSNRCRRGLLSLKKLSGFISSEKSDKVAVYIIMLQTNALFLSLVAKERDCYWTDSSITINSDTGSILYFDNPSTIFSKFHKTAKIWAKQSGHLVSTPPADLITTWMLCKVASCC